MALLFTSPTLFGIILCNFLSCSVRRRGRRKCYVFFFFRRSLRPRSHAAELQGEAGNGGGVWPEPFVEALARKVALAAADGGGSLAAAPAVVTVFQVCSTWRTVSESEILWEALTRYVWDKTETTRRTQSWRDEYIRLHLTASNFHRNKAKYTSIEYEVSSDSSGNGVGAACRCLALSPGYLAVGFFDGAVRGSA